jgi:hypothetical protein
MKLILASSLCLNTGVVDKDKRHLQVFDKNSKIRNAKIGMKKKQTGCTF